MNYLPHHREIEDLKRESNAIATAFCLLVLIITVGVMCWFAVDAIVSTVENEETEVKRRYASETYQRPAAYRMQTPTAEQMDNLYHIQRIQEVRR